MTRSNVETSIEPVLGEAEKKRIRVSHVDDEAGFLKGAKQILEMQDNFEVQKLPCLLKRPLKN